MPFKKTFLDFFQVRKNPIAPQRAADPKIKAILSKEFFSTFSFEANFTIFPEAELESRKKKLLRFVKMDVCGPMARPKKE
jgi:hypothetical protein